MMSIKNTGSKSHFTTPTRPVNSDPSVTLQQEVSSVEQVKSQASQNSFEAFAPGSRQQASRAEASSLPQSGKVTTVFQQAIAQLSGVNAVGSAAQVGEMSRDEVRTLNAQTDRFLGQMQTLASDRPEALEQSIKQIFGEKLDQAGLSQLVSQAKDGTFPLPQEVRFVDSELLRGADAAYSSQDGGLVLLNRDLKDRPARLQIALTEEIGHHLDQVMGGGDSIGDEGELFQRAIAKGGPLSRQELRSGKLDSDQGTIQLKNGQSLDVEFRSDKSARYYEAQGSFNKVDLRAAGRVSLKEDINDKLIKLYNEQNAGSPITTVKELRAHLRSEGKSIVTERLHMENKMFQEMTGLRQSPEDIEKKLVHKFRRRTHNGKPIQTAEDVKAYCKDQGRSFEREMAYAERKLWGKDRKSHTEALGQTVVEKAQAATLIAKLKKGEVLGETTHMGTMLPADVRTRVQKDPVLSKEEPPIQTYGQLFQALNTDVDNDGKSDFDALQLGRFLPHTSQQEILKSLDATIDSGDLKDMLRGVGFEHRLLDRIAERGTLSTNPPKAFGLEGRTDIDRTQQQLLLRSGHIFMDSNEDGKIDDSDAVQYVDSDGSIREATYGELHPQLRKMVRYNIATTKACEEYAAKPSWERMKFPHYNSSTGESTPEKVNEDFWEISKAEVNRNQTSWELKEGVRPDEALNDVFNGNGGKYTTECAHGRTLLRLKGLNNYYTSEFGEGLGAFKFNALFAKSPADKEKAAEFVAQFETFQKDNPGKSWDDFVQANPEPKLEYGLEVSRHAVLGANESHIQPWRTVDSESASGDTGYFHNYSVSVEGVKIGYVGENVIDMGFKDGERQYWGHPGGIQSEEKWSHELGNSRIAVKAMKEYEDYFSALDITRGSARVTKERVADLKESITDLESKKPAGWEDKVKETNQTIGWWKALDVARQGVANDIDPTKVELAEKFFNNPGWTSKAEDFNPLLESMTPEGIDRLANGFQHFGEEQTESIVKYFNKSEADELSKEEKASALLLLTYAQNGKIHPVLRDEGNQSVKNIHFGGLKSWLEPGGAMENKEAFQTWLKSPDFQTWFKDQSNSSYAGETDLSKMTVAEVKALVEMVFPMTKGMRTIYSDVNSGNQQLSEQMATLLKDGKLPEAKYALDSNPVAPLE